MVYRIGENTRTAVSRKGPVFCSGDRSNRQDKDPKRRKSGFEARRTEIKEGRDCRNSPALLVQGITNVQLNLD